MLYVATPVYYGNNPSRINYFKQHVENTKKLLNFEDLNFIFFVEPNSEPMLEIINDNFKKNTTIFKNQFQCGIELNYYNLFHYCFENLKLENMFFFEDDAICSNDSSILIEWASKKELLHTSMLCLLNKHFLFNKNHKIYSNITECDLLKLEEINYLSAWGCGVGKGFWDKYLKPTWSMMYAFDTNLTNKFTKLPIISPAINRLNHIGRTGVHYTESEFMNHGFDFIKIFNSEKKVHDYNLLEF